MAPDSTGQQRLTLFTYPAATQGLIPDAVVANLNWSPDGDRIAIHVVRLTEDSEAIYIVELEEGFRR